MTTAEERIVLTRWSPLMALCVLVITGTLAVGPLLSLLNAHTVTDRVTMGLLTAVFSAPFLWTLRRIPKTLRGMGIAVDHNGIHSFDGNDTATYAWSDIARIGFGSYARTYRGIKTKTMPALEIYLKGAETPAHRVTISPYGQYAKRIEEAVVRFHPELWGGPFLHER
jgi:hypothetical protein